MCTVYNENPSDRFLVIMVWVLCVDDYYCIFRANWTGSYGHFMINIKYLHRFFRSIDGPDGRTISPDMQNVGVYNII